MLSTECCRIILNCTDMDTHMHTSVASSNNLSAPLPGNFLYSQ